MSSVPPLGRTEPAPTSAVVDTRPTLRGWIHVGAFVAAVASAPFLVARAPSDGAAVAVVIYVVSLAALFGVSAAFHRVPWSAPARRRMQRADHTMIFVAIAGTYTAVAGLALNGVSRVLILCIAWAGAGVGILLRQVWLEAPKWAVTLPYVVVGWCALVVAAPLFHSLGTAGFVLLVMGGLFYSAGALTYARHRPDPWPGVFGYHEVFHACTVVGASLHFTVIIAFALQRA